MLPPELKSKIAKRSSQKGGEGERGAAKLIAAYFGLPWDQAFIRTKRTTGGAQIHGDILPIGEMARLWTFGTIEVKNRTEWTFDQIFKNPEGCKLAGYYFKSKEDTKDENTIVIFTKPGTTYYVLHVDDYEYGSVPHLNFKSNDSCFVVLALKDFLLQRFPR